MKDNKILFGTALAVLLLLTTGLSYAYFSTVVKENDNAKDMVVEAGTLKLTYTDGPAINAQNIKPGWSTTKEVSVKNNGTLDTTYNIIWQELTNTIFKNELVISATCEKINTNGVIDKIPCDSISKNPIKAKTIAKIYQLSQDVHISILFSFLLMN